MLCVCVRDVMDVVFSICIVTRGGVGVSISSCRCMFVYCVHPVSVLNAEFCMTCRLLMLVEDVIGDHTEEAYSSAGIMTASCHQSIIYKVTKIPPWKLIGPTVCFDLCKYKKSELIQFYIVYIILIYWIYFTLLSYIYFYRWI